MILSLVLSDLPTYEVAVSFQFSACCYPEIYFHHTKLKSSEKQDLINVHTFLM